MDNTHLNDLTMLEMKKEEICFMSACEMEEKIKNRDYRNANSWEKI